MMPAYIGQRQTEKVVQDESQTTFRLNIFQLSFAGDHGMMSGLNLYINNLQALTN
jgi:hypothetical protein